MREQVLSGTNMVEYRSLYHSIHQKVCFFADFPFLGEGWFTIVIFWRGIGGREGV